MFSFFLFYGSPIRSGMTVVKACWMTVVKPCRMTVGQSMRDDSRSNQAG